MVVANRLKEGGRRVKVIVGEKAYVQTFFSRSLKILIRDAVTTETETLFKYSEKVKRLLHRPLGPGSAI